MSEVRRVPRDQHVRERLLREFDRNLLVEAGAGSGKTHSLASRMAAGIAAGQYRVEHMAAVTFTRKAAAELRGRFRLALEDRLTATGPGAQRRRLEEALAGVERLFAGTIHAFCAHLLRERPIEAGVAPGFTELDDVENEHRRREAWREYVAAARAAGAPAMLDLLAAGVRPADLDHAFAIVCEHEEVEFHPGDGDPPDLDEALADLEALHEELRPLLPPAIPAATTCRVQGAWEELEGRLANARRQRRLPAVARLVERWYGLKVTQRWWSSEAGRDGSFGERARDLVEWFHDEVAEPFLAQWRAYVHRLAMRVLLDGREAFARTRRRDHAVNFVDLLRRTADTLRERADVRRALQAKYRWLFVDEFQDTDPLQAEIFLMLAADEESGAGARRGDVRGRAARCDPFATPLRPGALFLVGDPKQSIYRFRRADIDIYQRVRQRLLDTGGAVLSLTANFRSRPALCDFANAVFPPLFAAHASPYSPAFEPLDAVREEPGRRARAPFPLARLPVPALETAGEVRLEEARRVAAFVRGEVDAGRRRYGDFLVIARTRPRLSLYAEAFDAVQVPVEVSGAGQFAQSPWVRALARLLRTLADPLDSVSLVGVLRGPLFGLSDPELFRFRQAGGRFDLLAPLPQAGVRSGAGDGSDEAAPVVAALARLRGMLRWTRRLPLAVAVERVLEETGWLALAAATPSGAGAGHLLQAIDRVRAAVEAGGGLADAADALDAETMSTDTETLPLYPGRRDVVRLMNLHRAKGLEAPVVILVDPTSRYEFPVTVRIVRDGDRARGYLMIPASGADEPWRRRPLGMPIDWARHEAEELKYVEAERLRLLYVAATRARDQLVVCTVEERGKLANRAWQELTARLADAPEVDIPEVTAKSATVGPDVSKLARACAAEGRERTHAAVRQPSYALASPTGAARRVAERVADGPDERGTGEADHPGPGTTRVTGGAEADAIGDAHIAAGMGAAWGALVHGLLEHALRHEASTHDALMRLARWLAIDTPALGPHLGEAVSLVEAVTAHPFWRQVQSSDEARAEVPFAVRVDPGESVPGMGTVEMPTILHGVIDLAYRAGDRWRVVDYKTDRLDPGVDPGVMLRTRHGAQVGQYAFAWQRLTGTHRVAAAIVSVRDEGVDVLPLHEA